MQLDWMDGCKIEQDSSKCQKSFLLFFCFRFFVTMIEWQPCTSKAVVTVKTSRRAHACDISTTWYHEVLLGTPTKHKTNGVRHSSLALGVFSHNDPIST